MAMASTRYTRSRSRDTAPPPSSSQQQQQQQLTPRGNLESVLKTYDKKTKMEDGDDDQYTRLMSSSLTPPQSSTDQQTNELYNLTATTQAQQNNEQHLLSATTAGAAIHIPAELNSANNTINSANISDDTDDDRERSMTLGSEFDIIMKDGRGMSISDYYYNTNNNSNNSRLRGDSTASASNFLNGLFDQSFISVPEVVSSSHQKEQQQQQQQQYEQNSLSNLSQQPIGGGGQSSMKNDTNTKKMMISHTPPTQFGINSYENSHFGKRMRSGVS
jgi:hypothetical protein